MNTQDYPKITLDALPSGENLVKINVNIKNAPNDLFGAAFHLQLTGSDWQLSKFENGNVFNAPGYAPLIMTQARQVSDRAKEIVFGISLRRTDKVAASDGTLVSFYLQTDPAGKLQIDFTDTRLSVMNSQRVDLKNVTWEGADFDFKSLAAAQSSLQTNLQANVIQPAEDTSLYKAEAAQFYSAMLMWLLVFVALIGAYFIYRWLRVAKK